MLRKHFQDMSLPENLTLLFLLIILSRLIFQRGNLFNCREDILESTLVHLTEPIDNTEMYLIGTLNTSNILANRTRRLIEEIKPDVVFVQTNEKYFMIN
jgi:hypothetical protein